jgi:hypothetical protein
MFIQVEEQSLPTARPRYGGSGPNLQPPGFPGASGSAGGNQPHGAPFPQIGVGTRWKAPGLCPPWHETYRHHLHRQGLGDVDVRPPPPLLSPPHLPPPTPPFLFGVSPPSFSFPAITPGPCSSRWHNRNKREWQRHPTGAGGFPNTETRKRNGVRVQVTGSTMCRRGEKRRAKRARGQEGGRDQASGSNEIHRNPIPPRATHSLEPRNQKTKIIHVKTKTKSSQNKQSDAGKASSQRPI